MGTFIIPNICNLNSVYGRKEDLAINVEQLLLMNIYMYKLVIETMSALM